LKVETIMDITITISTSSPEFIKILELIPSIQTECINPQYERLQRKYYLDRRLLDQCKIECMNNDEYELLESHVMAIGKQLEDGERFYDFDAQQRKRLTVQSARRYLQEQLKEQQQLEQQRSLHSNNNL
jgi:hypothetical protein